MPYLSILFPMLCTLPRTEISLIWNRQFVMIQNVGSLGKGQRLLPPRTSVFPLFITRRFRVIMQRRAVPDVNDKVNAQGWVLPFWGLSERYSTAHHLFLSCTALAMPYLLCSREDPRCQISDHHVLIMGAAFSCSNIAVKSRASRRVNMPIVAAVPVPVLRYYALRLVDIPP